MKQLEPSVNLALDFLKLQYFLLYSHTLIFLHLTSLFRTTWNTNGLRPLLLELIPKQKDFRLATTVGAVIVLSSKFWEHMAVFVSQRTIAAVNSLVCSVPSNFILNQSWFLFIILMTYLSQALIPYLFDCSLGQNNWVLIFFFFLVSSFWVQLLCRFSVRSRSLSPCYQLTWSYALFPGWKQGLILCVT